MINKTPSGCHFTAIGVGLILYGCAPISQLPPPERPQFSGIAYGVSIVTPNPMSPGFGIQGSGIKKIDNNTLVGARIANLNTNMVSLIGGGVFYRKAKINTNQKYLGWEAEFGTGYVRGSVLTAYRKDNWQLFFSPGVQMQPNIELLQLTLPFGVTLWRNDRFSFNAEMSTSLNFWDLFDGEFITRINPTIGLTF